MPVDLIFRVFGNKENFHLGGVQHIEKKTGKDVTDAFAKILKEAQGRKPQTLKTDADEELYNQTFQELLKKKYIHHFSIHGEAKASIVQ